MTSVNEDYATIYTNEGGDPSFEQIDAYLRVHFNAHAEYNDAPADGLYTAPCGCVSDGNQLLVSCDDLLHSRTPE